MKTKSKKTTRPPFKCHGGKYYLAKWVISQMPEGYENMAYVEPFCGGASVFLNKNRSQEECLNDLDTGIVQIFRALRDEPSEFIGILKRLSYSEKTFQSHIAKKQAKDFEDYLHQAVNEFVLRRMSRGGLMKNFAWSTRTRGGQPGDLNAWQTIIEELPIIAEEFKKSNVYIMNEPAIKVINVFNDPNTLLYLDPPYLPETRTVQNAYECEMTTEDHIKLAEAANNFKGKVIVSGYPSKLYKRLYESVKVLTKDKVQKNKWRCIKKAVANHSSQSKKKEVRVEALWINY